MKTGLVLEGGAMRGMFTAGVLDVLMEQNIEVDGGISDSIPLSYFQSIGYDKNIVVLTQPRSYVKKENKLLPVMKLKLKKYPKLLETMKNRHIHYNETLKYIRREEAKGSVLVLCPKEKLPVGRIEHNPENLKKVYEIGRETALEQLEEIKNTC